MASGIKPSAANIIAEFCGPIVREKENEPDTTSMVREVITNLAISKIRSEKSVESDRFEFDILSIDGNEGGSPFLSVLWPQRFSNLNRDTEVFAGNDLTLSSPTMSVKIDF